MLRVVARTTGFPPKKYNIVRVRRKNETCLPSCPRRGPAGALSVFRSRRGSKYPDLEWLPSCAWMDRACLTPARTRHGLGYIFFLLMYTPWQGGIKHRSLAKCTVLPTRLDKHGLPPSVMMWKNIVESSLDAHARVDVTSSICSRDPH